MNNFRMNQMGMNPLLMNNIGMNIQPNLIDNTALNIKSIIQPYENKIRELEEIIKQKEIEIIRIQKEFTLNFIKQLHLQEELAQQIQICKIFLQDLNLEKC